MYPAVIAVLPQNNRLQTTRNCEVNITGSSAKLLVKEIATEF